MRRAFTLVEIMIAVAIIAVLVMLATPNIFRSRIIAQESTAISNLKVIANACNLYYVTEGNFPSALTDLSSANPPYLDDVLAAGQKQRYQFVYDLPSSEHYTLNANPLSTGIMKGKYYYTDETGIITSNSSEAAGPNDEVIQ